jgi:hypothetical protein
LSFDLCGRGYFTVGNFRDIGNLGHLLKVKNNNNSFVGLSNYI